MWFWNKKHTIAASGILAGATDHHSHILPGVDDGVESMEEALRVLQKYEKAGIKAIWFTPHIMEDVPNTAGKLTKRFDELKAAYNGNIELHLAAEYMIDNHLHKLLQDCHSEPQGGISTPKENTLLPIGEKGNHLLVETSYFNPPMRLHETLKQIKSIGYHPLLAHPERYMYMSKEEYIELHEDGVKFQLNMPSLAGCYGTAVKKKAEWLLGKGLYSVAGSDLHCEDAIEYITGCKLSEKQIEQMKELLHSNI